MKFPKDEILNKLIEKMQSKHPEIIKNNAYTIKGYFWADGSYSIELKHHSRKEEISIFYNSELKRYIYKIEHQI